MNKINTDINFININIDFINMQMNTIIQPFVGADLPRPQPIMEMNKIHAIFQCIIILGANLGLSVQRKTLFYCDEQ